MLFITANPNIIGETSNEIVDYSTISRPVNNITFLNLIWGKNDGPPVPVISVNTIKQLLDYEITAVSPDRISIGLPIIGYDWALPYIAGKTEANSLTIDAAINLANDTGTVIQFDDLSQTPFFLYYQYHNGLQTEHITRFIDARTIDALLNLITGYELAGIGVWNAMTFYDQLWLMINARYEIKKIIPDNL